MAAGTSGARLMERAGRAVADAICAAPQVFYPDVLLSAARAAILCGPGNNGGDGYVIARILRERGFAVDVIGLVPTDGLTGDARALAEFWQGPVHPPRRFLGSAAGEPRLIVDALFGTGLTRPLEGDAAALIARANTLSGFKMAVDIPSGLNADTGEATGAVFDADLTVTFHARKPGHLLHPGRAHCGALMVADIGLGAQATERARLTTDGPDITGNDASARIARLGTDPGGHKYTRGHCLVLAGGIEGIGAARLAARGAMRAGAGLVTLGVPPSALLAHASRGPDALMLRRCDGPEGLVALLADKRRNAVVIGPAYGLGEATRAAVAAVLESGRPAVLDADALTSFEGAPDALAELTRKAGNTIISPHAGEFDRLFSQPRLKTARKRGKQAAVTIEEPLVDGVYSTYSVLHKALAASAHLSAVVIHKGPTTVIAAPDGRAAINTNAPPWLATAGSGDVLAGIAGGLLSQGLSPYDAACAAVWLHGEAGRVAGRGLIADDLPEAIHTLLSDGY